MFKYKKTEQKAKHYTIIRAIAFLLFITYICYGFVLFCLSAKEDASVKGSVESYFNDIHNKEKYIDIYGASQKLLGKKQIENFSIYRNSYDRLVQPRAELSTKEIEARIDELSEIWQFLNRKGTPYYYIECPLPIMGDTELPYGVHDYSKSNADSLHAMLPEMPVIDLNDSITVSKEELFYRTDHHWSGDASFDAYRAVIERLDNDGIISNKHSRDDFERVSVEGFLGSYGVKVGKFYAGTEDFVYYSPSFQTDLSYTEMKPDGSLIDIKTGEWSDTVMDKSVLEDTGFKNKYNAFLWGNDGQNRIVNLLDDSNKKVLLISHSYGRPVAAYLALDCSEIVHLDPQEGRFDGDFLAYIEEYDPDVVLFLCEFEGEIIGEYSANVK